MLAGLAISSSGRVERFSFVFGSGAFRENEIFDLANCPPSRYLVEIGRRLIMAMPDAEILAIGNPLLPLGIEQVGSWLELAALGSMSGPAIVSDVRDFPLLYVVPRFLFDRFERFLLLLSTVDAFVDERLLVQYPSKT